jgi:hypothetical protein
LSCRQGAATALLCSHAELTAELRRQPSRRDLLRGTSHGDRAIRGDVDPYDAPRHPDLDGIGDETEGPCGARRGAAAAARGKRGTGAESIRLAMAYPDVEPGNPWWSSLEPAFHIGRAGRESRASVASLLLAKYRRLPPGSAIADTLRVLDRLYCGAPSRAADPGQSLAEVFRWTSIQCDPRGTGPLRLWFTAESVLLAARGGYANPARNVTEPRGHWDWTLTVAIRFLIRDLADKSHEQYQHAIGAGESEAVRFSAEVMARYAAWGGQLPDANNRSGVPARWEGTCRAWFRDDPRGLWRRIDGMLRDTAWRLLSRGRIS